MNRLVTLVQPLSRLTQLHVESIERIPGLLNTNAVDGAATPSFSGPTHFDVGPEPVAVRKPLGESPTSIGSGTFGKDPTERIQRDRRDR